MSRDHQASSQHDGTAGDVVVLSQGDHTLVILYGDVDVRVSEELEHAGRFSIDAARRTVMDVRHVTMMDSVGVSFVVRLAAGLRSAGTELELQGPSRRVAELITLVGAGELARWLPELPLEADVSAEQA
ncbi:STAS domain-containing protein [Kineosporia sp. J2-2]|uniref:STAS domain-containing protein n=1 Tax=Kineosporia corallincola TaxID=2835133 RepID=A0ABS5TLC0_9ACTN|nr:STAS domain-containing protein [Kineosporia corallincola]MBT0771902.1 STAS domain-containing protein [Kineosporia corallincola]